MYTTHTYIYSTYVYSTYRVHTIYSYVVCTQFIECTYVQFVVGYFPQNMRYVANGGEWSQMFVEALEEYESDNFDGALLKYLLLGELGYEKAQSNAAHILETYHLEFVSNEEDNFRRSLMMWKRAAAHGRSNVFVMEVYELQTQY